MLRGRSRNSCCVEIRSYELHASTQSHFQQVFAEAVVPLLNKWRTNVIFAGPSQHACDTFVLVRAYRDIAEREASQKAFYNSSDWRNGPRAAVLGLIKAYTSAVVTVDAPTLEMLRNDLSHMPNLRGGHGRVSGDSQDNR